VNATPHASGHAYPRPQLRREDWTSLNGVWDFSIDRDAACTSPSAVPWDQEITVPFSPEAPASGIGDTGLYDACWYRRLVELPCPEPGRRVILHFGAVDYAATVWVNGSVVVRHRGGYTPFKADITDVLGPSGVQEIVVRAEDPPDDLAKPRGKQDWLLEPHSIWYPRTSGIWQTVWVEEVPVTRIGRLRWTSNLDRWEIGLEARIDGYQPPAGMVLRVLLEANGEVLARDTYDVMAGEVHRRIALSDPGIDDFRNALLWRPSAPTLIDAHLELVDADGAVVDVVESYTALRTIDIDGDRVLLNGRPYPMQLVLDQGYWEETGLTAPDDEALRRDVELAKAMGFNGVRKHQKLEDPRYLYWADRLGLLVWGEMPSAYRFTRRSVERLTREWMEALDRDYSHPCIVAWVPFNESWGVPNLPTQAAQRSLVQALYHLTKTLDGTRPVIGNDGWESVATDIVGVHDYADDPEELRRRYHTAESLPSVLWRERPGGRLIMLDADDHAERPVMLTEFGGIALSREAGESWGYSRSQGSEDLQHRYTALLDVVRSLPLLSGFCYTQFADTYQETNGLLYADRTPKFPIEAIREATSRPTNKREQWILAGYAGEMDI